MVGTANVSKKGAAMIADAAVYVLDTANSILCVGNQYVIQQPVGRGHHH